MSFRRSDPLPRRRYPMSKLWWKDNRRNGRSGYWQYTRSFGFTHKKVISIRNILQRCCHNKYPVIRFHFIFATPMRFFAFIMTFIVLVVSLAPCRDLSCVPKDKKAIAHFTINDHQSHDDGSDECPPFCSCACCSVPGATKSDIISPSIISIDLTQNVSRYTGELISVSLPIWQPPQLASWFPITLNKLSGFTP